MADKKFSEFLLKGALAAAAMFPSIFPITDANGAITGYTNNLVSAETITGRRAHAYTSSGIQSLAHLDVGYVKGDVFQVDNFDLNKQDGSTAGWRILEVRSSPITTGIGAISNGGSSGIVMEAVNYQMTLIPMSGDVVDIRAAGIRCKASVTGQHTKLNTIIAAAIASRYVLTGAGEFSCTETIDMRLLACDFSNLLFRPYMGGITLAAYSATGTPSGFVPFYSGGPTGSQSGIVTMDFPRWGGGMDRIGIMIRAGGNGKNALYAGQRFYVHGDGNFDFTRMPTCVPVRFEDNDSPISQYDVNSAYSFGPMIAGPAEKHQIICRGSNNVHAVGIPAGASADTLDVQNYATVCQHWYTETPGTDTSIILTSFTESRADPGNGAPAEYYRNGKFTKSMGECRASNGYRALLVDTPVTASGATSLGADTLFFDKTWIHGYGAFEFMRFRFMAGTIMTKDMGNNNNPYDAGTGKGFGPAGHSHATMGRFFDASGFNFIAFKNLCSVGLTIGDETAAYYSNGLYAHDASFGTWSVNMGANETFTATNTEIGASTAFPIDRVALMIKNVKGGDIELKKCNGKVIADGAQVRASDTGPFVAYLPRTQKRFTRQKLNGATIDFVCLAGDTLSFATT